MSDEDRHVARIIGIDPGKATGAAVVDLWYLPKEQPQSHVLLRNFHIKPRTICTIGWEERSKILRILVQDAFEVGLPLVVANEKYLVTRLTQQSQDTQALEVTGTLETILDLLEVPHTYITQLPSSAKLLMTDERLKTMLGFDLKGIDGHARDALRHACTWCAAYVRNKVQITTPKAQ